MLKKAIMLAIVVGLAGAGGGYALATATRARAAGDAPEATPSAAARVETAPAAAISAAPRVTIPEAPSVAPPTPAREEPAPIARELRVRRMTLTSGVEGREPIDELTAVEGSSPQPVYVFVDLANAGDAMDIEVMLEHEDGARVGFVELHVPAHVARWRTWAISRNVTRPGRWTAIVRDASGTVLEQRELVVR